MSLRHPVGWRQRLARMRGSSVAFDLSTFDRPLDAINALAADTAALSDQELEGRARAFRDQIRAGARVGDVRVAFFALTREAAHRALGLRPFDVQLIAALAMDRGAVVDMQTGEGKTLAAVMPAALNALAGHGVHVLTVNDYLARRDAEWMRPVYTRLGLDVGFVQQGMSPAMRRRAYLADVTYVTAKEAGFDHLRDLLATDAQDLVHRVFQFALVDEADSLLIDEARVPLVIAGRVDREGSTAERMAHIVRQFKAGVHFDTDEYQRDVELTEAGIAHAEAALASGRLHDPENYARLTELNCALHAHALLRRDVDYIVRDGAIGIVDELTGRVVPDRHWPDGLQAALEAKEHLVRQADGQILGSITVQDFLKGYPRLCGMTGTAQDGAQELREVYGLGVVVVPTHHPVIRIDHPDVVFATREAKEQAVVEDVRRTHAADRPVLVGTLTIEESERLAARLRDGGLACRVLNARNDAAEAEIVAAAGAPGAVTIATNMAGRGTDIRLGGDHGAAEHVAGLGGLYIVSTNRHESRRIDLQLRGRAGRQGDPGESRFFISLEDDLLVRFGLRGLLAGRFAPGDRDPADPIDSPLVAHEIARAQRIIEGQNGDLRRTLWRYSSVIERHRARLMARRRARLCGDTTPTLWLEDPDRRASLVAAAGEDAVQRAESRVTIGCIDHAWYKHLARAADLREGIHLVGLGGKDPLTEFTREIDRAFRDMEEDIDDAVVDALTRVRVIGATLDLDDVIVKGPSSTWTYLVNDDPFKNRIASMLTGPGRTTIGITSAIAAMPLLVLWGLFDWLKRRRSGRR
jgi:preprotein translocase subunit SecA